MSKTEDKFKAKIKLDNPCTIITGDFIDIRDGRITVLIDGYSCSDSFPVDLIVSVIKEETRNN